MFRHQIIAISMALLLILLSGCSNAQVNSSSTNSSYASTVSEENAPTSNSLQKLTEQSIHDRYKTADSIYFGDYKNIDHIGYLAFSYRNDQSLFYGFTVAEQNGNQWTLSYYEDFPNDTTQKVSYAQFIGTYPDTEERTFHINIGYINDKQISQVILNNPHSNSKTLQIAADQHVFLDIDNDASEALLKIECKSDDGKTIYQKTSE